MGSFTHNLSLCRLAKLRCLSDEPYLQQLKAGAIPKVLDIPIGFSTNPHYGDVLKRLLNELDFWD